LTPLSKK